MLTAEDTPTIKSAIMKRLGMERGVHVLDIPILVTDDAISVGVLATLDHSGLIVRSRFDLPLQFDLRHLHNEIDEIAEQYKAARVDYWGKGRLIGTPEVQLAGSGLRGRWAQYG